MLCPNCKRDIHINRAYCNFCGKKVEVEFDMVADSIKEDATTRRWRVACQFFTWVLVAGLFAGVVISSMTYLWDQKLLFDGSEMPSIDPQPIEYETPRESDV